MLSSSPSSRNARPGAARSLDWVSGRTDLTGAALRRSLDDATVGWLRALWADAARLLPGGRGDDGGPDGILCRDESIRMQDAEIARLRAEVDAILDVELVRFADALERLGR